MSSYQNAALIEGSNGTISYLLKILRIKQVIDKTGLCRSAIYAKAKTGQFPSPIKLGNGRSSGWLEHEVDLWLQQQIQSSRQSSKGDI